MSSIDTHHGFDHSVVYVKELPKTPPIPPHHASSTRSHQREHQRAMFPINEAPSLDQATT